MPQEMFFGGENHFFWLGLLALTIRQLSDRGST
jgi:hypothetical protein